MQKKSNLINYICFRKIGMVYPFKKSVSYPFKNSVVYSFKKGMVCSFIFEIPPQAPNYRLPS